MSQMSEFESQVSQLNSSLAHCQKMVAEYRGQLERSRVECERLVNEVRVKEQEMQQLKQESSLEEEKVYDSDQIHGELLLNSPFSIA